MVGLFCTRVGQQVLCVRHVFGVVGREPAAFMFVLLTRSFHCTYAARRRFQAEVERLTGRVGRFVAVPFVIGIEPYVTEAGYRRAYGNGEREVGNGQRNDSIAGARFVRAYASRGCAFYTT